MKNNMDRKIITSISLIGILFMIIVGFVLFNPSKHSQYSTDRNNLIYDTENVNSSGPGPNLLVLENVWGEKNDNNLQNDTYISRTVPDGWLGELLSVQVSNLTKKSETTLHHLSTSGYIGSGTNQNGNHTDTHDLDGNPWTIRWGGLLGTDLDLFLNYSTTAYPESVSEIEIRLVFSKLCSPRNLDFFIYNYYGDSWESLQSYNPDKSYDEIYTKSTNPNYYISSDGSIDLYFESTSQFNDDQFNISIDYLYINVTTARELVLPTQVGLTLNGSSISDLGILYLPGTYDNNTHNFFYDCYPQYSISFNSLSTMWIQRNQSIDSIYYIGTDNLPTNHFWTFNYNSETPVNYPSKEFSIYCPSSWTLFNASSPSGPITISIGYFLGNLSISINETVYEDGNWVFFCSSQNVITNIHIKELSQEVDIANITDILSISCDLSESNILGEFNLTVFNETEVVYNDFANTSGSSVIFNDWVISDNTTSNGIYTFSISWKNNTAIGYGKRNLTIIYPTEIIGYSIPEVAFKDNIIDIIIFYNNTFVKFGYNENGILGANLTFVMKNETGSNMDSGILIDQLNGNYSNTIDLQDYEQGNYTLIINASKRWYQNHSKTYDIEIFSFNSSINITLPFRNGVAYAVCNYSDTIIIKLGYYNFTEGTETFITGANLTIYKNLNPLSSEFWNESIIDEAYYIYLNSSKSELISSWNDINNNISLQITISKPSFIPKSFKIEWDIRNSTAKLSGSSIENWMSGNMSFNLNYTIPYKNQSISDFYSPNFEMFYNGTSYTTLKTKFLSNELWNISCLFNETTNVSYNIIIKVSSLGFFDTSVSFILNVNVISTIIDTINITSNIHYYQDLNFSIVYNRTNPILTGLDEAHIISSNFSLSQTLSGSGIYFIQVHTKNLLNISNYNIHFLIWQNHFQEINFSIQFNIINVTTNLSVKSSSEPLINGNHTYVFVNQSVSYRLEYLDLYKNEFISNSLVSTYIFDSQGQFLINITDFSMGSNYYSIRIDSFGFRPGNFTILIESYRQNYFESKLELNFTIKPCITHLTPKQDYPDLGIIDIIRYKEWYNHSIRIFNDFTGVFFNQFVNYTEQITWGYSEYIICKNEASLNDSSAWIINGTFNYDTQYNLFYSSIIPLEFDNGTNLPIGNYTVYIRNFARDCINLTKSFNLEIIPLLTGRIDISQISEVNIGQKFRIQIRLLVDEVGYSADIELNIVFKSADGELLSNNTFIIKTDANGFSEKYITAQEADSQIIINVIFAGETSSYPENSIEPLQLSNPLVIKVTEPFNPLPLILIVIFASVGAAMTFLIVKTKIIDPKKAKKFEMSLEKFNHFKDLTSINCLILIHKPKREIFYKKILIDKEFNDQYWYGINKSILEFTGIGKKTNAALDLVSYNSQKILLDDGAYIRLALLVEDYPSEMALRSVVDFIHYFEINNYNHLKDSELEKISNLEEFLDKIFGLKFIIPYTISVIRIDSVKLSSFQETLMNMARSLSDEGYFYISDLYKKVIEETLIEGMIIFETIQELLNKRVFVPYEVKTKKGKKIVRKFEAFQKNTDPLTEYREIVVSLNNKALNAITRNDYEEAIEIYQKIAELARVSNLHQEWRAYRNKVEAMKVELSRKSKITKPKETSKSMMSTTYSVKVSSLSQLRDKYDSKQKGKEKKSEKEKRDEVTTIIEKGKTKRKEAAPSDIEEIKSLISPKNKTKPVKYPKIRTDKNFLEDEIERLDSEIDEIDHEIKKKRKTESFEDLTPLEKALKFGLDLKDEEIFETGKDDKKTKDEEIEIIDKKIVKIKKEKVEEEEEKELNINNLNDHCPNCQSHISTRNLKLILKGYEPECDTCGKKLILKELIKETTKAKSLLESD